MLRCRSRYRNVALRLNLEPGELVRDLDEDMEAFLLRDSPGSFERVTQTLLAAPGTLPDAPPAHRMVEREAAVRKRSERKPGPVMSRADHPGLVRPKGG